MSGVGRQLQDLSVRPCLPLSRWAGEVTLSSHFLCVCPRSSGSSVYTTEHSEGKQFGVLLKFGGETSAGSGSTGATYI